VTPNNDRHFQHNIIHYKVKYNIKFNIIDQFRKEYNNTFIDFVKLHKSVCQESSIYLIASGE
jgi:hypothetical protein